MLGLAQEVGCHQLRVRALVGDHRHLGRPGEQVDPDPAEELALGLGDERIAGTDDHVHRGYRGIRIVEQAEGHRRQRLHAAEREDAVRSRGGDRMQCGRVQLPGPRR